MKSLKRTLSLVLVLVMVLGLVGIATATDFSDDDDIQYKEAVDVMSGIGAINGYTDGTFNPKGNVTRAEAAKMVAYAILGPTIAASLAGLTSSFKDVDENYAWAIPSIEYLVRIGAVNGRGDDIFDPQGSVTGLEIAKMMLCAAGYGKQGEFVGTGWDLAVMLLAQRQGLFAGANTESFVTAATREEAALYTFNGLMVNLVKYSKDTETYELVLTTSRNPAPIPMYKNVYPGTKGLIANIIEGEAFGGYIWLYKGKEISSFIPTTPVLGIITNASISGHELATTYKFDTITSVYVNGNPMNYLASRINTAITNEAVKGNTDATRLASFAGATFYLLDTTDNGKVDRIVVEIPYLAKVTKVNDATLAGDRSIDVTVYIGGATPSFTIETDEFEKGDLLLIVPGSDIEGGFESPTSMKLATTIIAKPSSYNKSKESFVVEGKTYVLSAFINNNMKGFDPADALATDLGSTYTFILGVNGTIIGSLVYSSAAAQSYMYVTRVEANKGDDSILAPSVDAAKVRGTLMDGTTAVYDMTIKTAGTTAPAGVATGDRYITFLDPSGDPVNKEINTLKAKLGGNDDFLPAGMYAFTLSDSGAITLSKKLESEDAAETTGEMLDAAADLVTVKGSAFVEIDSAKFYASSLTKLVVVSGAGVSTYTGYANFPSKTFTAGDDPGEYMVGYVYSGNAVTHILCIGATVADDAKFDAYGLFLGKGDTTSDGQYYDLMVNGAVKTYLLTDDSDIPVDPTDVGKAYAIALDSKGKADLTLKDDSDDVKYVGENYVILDSADTEPLYLAANVQVYNVMDPDDIFADELEAGDTITYITEGSGSAERLVVAYITARPAP